MLSRAFLSRSTGAAGTGSRREISTFGQKAREWLSRLKETETGKEQVHAIEALERERKEAGVPNPELHVYGPDFAGDSLREPSASGRGVYSPELNAVKLNENPGKSPEELTTYLAHEGEHGRQYMSGEPLDTVEDLVRAERGAFGRQTAVGAEFGLPEEAFTEDVEASYERIYKEKGFK